jgi:hypothetical protein
MLFKRRGRKMIAVDFTAEDVKALRKKNKELQEQLDEHHDAIRNLRDVEGRFHTVQAVQRILDLLPKQ